MRVPFPRPALSLARSRRHSLTGFTLIELLVVIAIIGILASIVLANLNIARIKARDARRISDVKQIQLTLELFYDAYGYYPASIYPATGGPLSPFIANVPMDPLGTGLAYNYTAINIAGTAALSCDATSNLCPSYHIGAVLGDSVNFELQSDADNTVGFNGTSHVVEGTAGGCSTTGNTPQPGGGPGGETCFDVK